MLGLQHVVTLDIRLQHIAVAPPRGVRGLKFDYLAGQCRCHGRTPSWGARIEIRSQQHETRERSRTPLWGAWIEIFQDELFRRNDSCTPSWDACRLKERYL